MLYLRKHNSTIIISLTVQTHDSDTIRFHRFEWACCSVWKYHFQTVRDNTKQSDWPLPGENAPHLHRIKLSTTFFARYAQNGGPHHNGLPPVELQGIENYASNATRSWVRTVTPDTLRLLFKHSNPNP